MPPKGQTKAMHDDHLDGGRYTESEIYAIFDWRTKATHNLAKRSYTAIARFN